MNKAVVVLLILLGMGAAIYLVNSSITTQPNDQQIQSADQAGGSSGASSESIAAPEDSAGGVDTAEAGGAGEIQDRPATEIYKSADEALAAIKGGATNYDDLILEQFSELGPDCTWCDDVYRSVKELLNSSDTPTDQRSYYAELLAVSGRVDNVQTLVEAIKNPQPGQDTQVFLEALELTAGKDDVVSYLGGELNSVQNPTLKESIIAAVTNQGSSLAVNTLYKAALDSKDPDAFYSQGTGLGELIPNPEAFGPLKEIVLKKDDYSHLGVKALLNAGLDGFKEVVDILSNSTSPEADEKLVKDALDHIPYDEATEKYISDVVSKSSNPVLAKLAKSKLEEYAQEAQNASESLATSAEGAEEEAIGQ